MEQHIILSVAGSDSSAGAGIQADIKSVMACGGYCATAITALTAQNTMGVNAIEIVGIDIFSAQVDAVMNDLNVKAIKIGMLPSVDMVKYLSEVIIKSEIKNVVLDPVMVSTSGSMLVAPEVTKAIIEILMPLSTVVTPNIPECEYITGLNIAEERVFDDVARYFKNIGCKSLLLKSGHMKGGNIRDYLYDFSRDKSRVYCYERIDTINTHGTGCSLSSALATFLGMGYDIEMAVEKAEDFVHEAILSANYVMGGGHGAINHAYANNK